MNLPRGKLAVSSNTTACYIELHNRNKYIRELCTRVCEFHFHPLIGYDMSCDNIEYFIENHAQTHEPGTK